MTTPTKQQPSNISKKLLNSKRECVTEAISGLLCWNPGLATLDGFDNVVLRHDWNSPARRSKVSLLTGGGSGHEPCFSGFVGEGMVTCAVQGHIFAAPSAKSILAAIMALNWNKQGVLVLFNNYTGDRVNFGLAIEKARAKGVKIEIVINADDCALNDGWREVNRRGLAGIILLLKMVGYVIESGDPLEKVAEFARECVLDIATMGVSWSSCSFPGGGPLFELGADEMEIGLGWIFSIC
ncbi:hypothetical protein HELRODRAFT_108945 [Helobdella robusta]|uniref:DhaK domain-containing protein n=1 Tax=Helobdella robusta TaxID=6412 RepID=T1EEP2_HELRO|nr:hypothetical protein HELRODRAFT_108945 [Helobdella robusta]ESO11712.1 hypothetical protein HELRODRAFT_108945 [Helobdella robusta]